LIDSAEKTVKNVETAIKDLEGKYLYEKDEKTGDILRDKPRTTLNSAAYAKLKDVCDSYKNTCRNTEKNIESFKSIPDPDEEAKKELKELIKFIVGAEDDVQGFEQKIVEHLNHNISTGGEGPTIKLVSIALLTAIENIYKVFTSELNMIKSRFCSFTNQYGRIPE
jgi:hypothetical protein